MKAIDEWVRTCLHKKKMTEWQCDAVIERAKPKELRKYYCPHCFHWHITSKIRKALI